MTASSARRRIVVSLGILLLGVVASAGLDAGRSGAGSPPRLLADAEPAAYDALAPDPDLGAAHVVRSRLVTVNTRALFARNGTPLPPRAMPAVELNLFPDATYLGQVTDTDQDRWGTYWSGTLKGTSGYFTLVDANGVFIAHVASPEGVYEVSWAGSRRYRVVQIDQSSFVDHAPDAEFDEPGEVLEKGSLGPEADSGGIIDIMVAYTNGARAAEGGRAQMLARIALAVKQVNDSYANSGVMPRLRLVHTVEYTYTESGKLATDLARLASTNDAYFSTIHALRDTHGADLVGLIVKSGDACGLAQAILAGPANAFQVTSRTCTTSDYSFAHEFGHLQGARHDMYTDRSLVPFAHGHGYVHKGTTAAQRWRTVMALDDACQKAGYKCTRLKWWSNPSKSYNGAPTGNSSAKNALVLSQTAYTIANFRLTKKGVIFYDDFVSSAPGWSAVTGAWAVSGGSYRSTGFDNLFASAAHTGTYGNFMLEAVMRRSSDCPTCANNLVIRGNPTSFGTVKEWLPSYTFQYTNDGHYSVWLLTSGGASVCLSPWAVSRAIVKNGWNTLKVVAVGSSLQFSINNTLLWSGRDMTVAAGQVGFQFYRKATPGTLDVDWIRLSQPPTASLSGVVAPQGETVGGTITEANRNLRSF